MTRGPGRKKKASKGPVVLTGDIEDDFTDPDLPDIEELRLQMDEGARLAMRDILTEGDEPTWQDLF